jgi:cytochrome c oxidase subunit 3
MSAPAVGAGRTTGPAAGTVGAEAIAAAAERRLDTTYVGVMLFIASEAMFFVGLFGAYFTARNDHPAWPPPSVHLDLPLAAVLTVVLVTSSGTMQLALRAIRRGDRAGMQRAMLVTVVLGIVFLCGQAYDYATLRLPLDSGSYAAAFYTLTGFHGAHVLGGVIAITVMLARAAGGQFTARHHAAVEGVAAYWHFVDIVWLFVFSTVFLVR